MAPPVSHCTAVESSNHHHHIMLSYGGHTHHVITWSSFRLGFTCTDRQKSKWTMGAPFQQELKDEYSTASKRHLWSIDLSR